MKTLILVLLAFGLSACATSGSQNIQKKCKAVDGDDTTFVCEQP